jgi:hypothetical protein
MFRNYQINPQMKTLKNTHLDYWLLYWYHCSEDLYGGLINLLRKKYGR